MANKVNSVTVEQAKLALENAWNNYGNPSPQLRAALRVYTKAVRQAGGK